MKTLDEIDNKIIRELRSNARIPLSSLSSLVHLSRNAVKQRIERLERDGQIRGYTILEGAAPRHDPVVAYLEVHRVDRLRGENVLELLERIPEIVLCDILTGNVDILVRVEAGRAERIQEIWREIASHPGVLNTTTSIALATHFSRTPGGGTGQASPPT